MSRARQRPNICPQRTGDTPFAHDRPQAAASISNPSRPLPRTPHKSHQAANSTAPSPPHSSALHPLRPAPPRALPHYRKTPDAPTPSPAASRPLSPKATPDTPPHPRRPPRSHSSPRQPPVSYTHLTLPTIYSV